MEKRIDRAEFERVALATNSLAETARQFGISKQRAWAIAKSLKLQFILVKIPSK